MQRVYKQYKSKNNIQFTKIANNAQSNIPYWSSVDGETLVMRLATWYVCNLPAQHQLIEEFERRLATIWYLIKNPSFPVA